MSRPLDTKLWLTVFGAKLTRMALTSTLVVEFLSRSAVSGCGGVEVVIGSTG